MLVLLYKDHDCFVHLGDLKVSCSMHLSKSELRYFKMFLIKLLIFVCLQQIAPSPAEIMEDLIKNYSVPKAKLVS